MYSRLIQPTWAIVQNAIDSSACMQGVMCPPIASSAGPRQHGCDSQRMSPPRRYTADPMGPPPLNRPQRTASSRSRIPFLDWSYGRRPSYPGSQVAFQWLLVPLWPHAPPLGEAACSRNLLRPPHTETAVMIPCIRARPCQCHNSYVRRAHIHNAIARYDRLSSPFSFDNDDLQYGPLEGCAPCAQLPRSSPPPRL